MQKLGIYAVIFILTGCTTTSAGPETTKDNSIICFKPECATKAESFFTPIEISTQNKVFQEMN